MNSLLSEAQWITLAVTYGLISLGHFMSDSEGKYSNATNFFGGLLVWAIVTGVALLVGWVITGGQL